MEDLCSLRLTFQAHEQANGSAGRGGIVRREPVTSEHPLVRTHPVRISSQLRQ
jgi:sulfonate dioxygenase